MCADQQIMNKWMEKQTNKKQTPILQLEEHLIL